MFSILCSVHRVLGIQTGFRYIWCTSCKTIIYWHRDDPRCIVFKTTNLHWTFWSLIPVWLAGPVWYRLAGFVWEQIPCAVFTQTRKSCSKLHGRILISHYLSFLSERRTLVLSQLCRLCIVMGKMITKRIFRKGGVGPANIIVRVGLITWLMRGATGLMKNKTLVLLNLKSCSHRNGEKNFFYLIKV